MKDNNSVNQDKVIPQFDWLQKYDPPFWFHADSGFILDQNDMPVAEVRGWGNLQSEKLQDQMGECIAAGLNTLTTPTEPKP